MTIRARFFASRSAACALITLLFSAGCSSQASESLPAEQSQGGSATGGSAAVGGSVSASGGTAAGGNATAAGSWQGGQLSTGGTAGGDGHGQAGQPTSGGVATSTSGGQSGGVSGALGSAGKSNAAGGASGNAGGGAGGVDSARPGWTLVFSDEFNGPSGTPVDDSKWNLVNRGDGFGNNELQFYSNRTANASLDGQGSLVIKAIKESYMGRAYTSARLESNGKVELTYGRIEGRLKLPFGQGIWPAFWMLGTDIGAVSWPTCGEIDIMENIGKEPSTSHGTLHGPGYSGGNPLGASYTLPSAQRFADAFHVFAVEWEKDVVRFYVDENLFKTRSPADVPAGARWVYDHPFYLLLNVAVGGAWPGSPDGTTTFPQTMSVDYVRVYRR